VLCDGSIVQVVRSPAIAVLVIGSLLRWCACISHGTKRML
jgi:hypothetical protein